jgi:hypothetical protein
VAHNVRRPLTVALITVCLFALGAPGAAAHFLGEDSVDGGEIRYGDETTYDDSRTWAINRYNDMPDGVNVAPDDAWNVEDLAFSDYNANDGNCGYWDANTGADDIKLNTDYYGGASQSNRRACTMHELGHAHRLAHSYADQVMDDCPVSSCAGGSAFSYLQDHDKSDYNDIW